MGLARPVGFGGRNRIIRAKIRLTEELMLGLLLSLAPFLSLIKVPNF